MDCKFIVEPRHPPRGADQSMVKSGCSFCSQLHKRLRPAVICFLTEGSLYLAIQDATAEAFMFLEALFQHHGMTSSR